MGICQAITTSMNTNCRLFYITGGSGNYSDSNWKKFLKSLGNLHSGIVGDVESTNFGLMKRDKTFISINGDFPFNNYTNCYENCFNVSFVNDYYNMKKNMWCFVDDYGFVYPKNFENDAVEYFKKLHKKLTFEPLKQFIFDSVML